MGYAGRLRPVPGPARRFAVHPQTRAILYRRLFWNVWHLLLLLHHGIDTAAMLRGAIRHRTVVV